MQVSEENFASAFDVSRETIAQLAQFERLLRKWNPAINLVSRATLGDLWHRHFADSAQIYQHVDEKHTSWLDFGSGAGFPGLVVAVLAKENRPDLAVTLVESDHRKAAFLLTVANTLGLNVSVKIGRIEEMGGESADVISARAVASLEQLLIWAHPHAHDSTVLLFPKGISYESELTAARKHWHIEAKVIPSVTDSGAVILRIEDFERVD